MQRKPIRWDSALKKLFSPARRKAASANLALEKLDDRIVPSGGTVTYHPNAFLADGAGVVQANGAGNYSLRAAISAANNDTKDSTFIFDLTQGSALSGAYTITIANPPSGHEQQNAAGDLNIVNNASGTKTYEFMGQGSGAYITRANNVLDRIFEINAKNNNLNVSFQNLTIAGGNAVDNGGVGTPNNSTTAEGGAILNMGGTLSLNHVQIDNNFALGAIGANGFNGSNATKTGQIPGSGVSGASGNSAAGGGLYSSGGTVTIIGSTFSGNQALGGHGGNGGNGGNWASKALTKSQSSQVGAAGGLGGAGGSAYGGAIYVAAGNLVFQSGSVISNNTALAGFGGAAGNGGNIQYKSKFEVGGPGGNGGAGGVAIGGGIYSKSGDITLNGVRSTVTLSNNNATGGAGGAAGAAGNGSGAENIGGVGGAGGAGGAASAGGLYSQLGNVTIENKAAVSGNTVHGGNGGAGGAGGAGDAKNKTSGGTGGVGGNGGIGGSVLGGGVYTVNGVVTIENSSSVKTNIAEAGAGGSGGHGGGGKVHRGVLGGNGGDGGDASGGGLYTGLGAVIVEQNSLVENNVVEGNGGGKGGVGGTVGTVLALPGNGGDGGTGGSVYGGGIYTTSGTITIESNSEVIQNRVTAVGGGGAGGAGGADSAKSSLVNPSGGGGTSSSGSTLFFVGAHGGNGGAGGNFGGGGIYNANGNVSVVTAAVVSNGITAPGGGAGGAGGAGQANGDAGGAAGNGGAGGNTLGGGIFTAKGIVTIGAGGFVVGNGANGGAGGRGGVGGAAGNGSPGVGGNGAAGGYGYGGGVYALAGEVDVGGETLNSTGKLVSGGVVENNTILGGAGGHGGRGGINAFNFQNLGGNGGTGGSAAGGGIWSSQAAVTLSGLVSGNLARAGHGGNAGQFDGLGGNAGSAQGGGVYSAYGAITIQGVSLKGTIYQGKVEGNTAEGGVGGSGGNVSFGQGGTGGNGGDGQGGGIFSAYGSVSVNNYALIASNQAKGNKGGTGGQGETGGTSGSSGGTGGVPTITGGTGGGGKTNTKANAAGGTGGNGGNAQGGGIYIGTGKLDVNQANISANVAGGSLHGGAGGGSKGTTGGEGGLGGNGGMAAGGGIYASSGASTLNILSSSIVNNTAGPGGVGGTGGAMSKRNGTGGDSVGGGIYTAANSLIVNSTIAKNFADEAGSGGLSQGGGLYVGVLAPAALGGVSIDNDTIALNTSFDDGGGLRNVGQITVTSTLIADNNSKNTAVNDFSNGPNATATLEYTVVGTKTGYSNATTDNTDHLQTADANVNLNNTLSTATSNDTKYVAFTGSSVAFDVPLTGTQTPNPAGLATDQIGNQRIVNKGATQYIDIGAIEVGGVAVGTPVIVAAGKGGFVQVTNSATLQVYQYFQPFPGYTGVVSVSLGDVSGDQIPDIIVAANGVVKVYDGASALTPGVNFAVPSTWTGNQVGGASILPGGITTPLLYSFTPFVGYKGTLNLAAGDVVGNGYDDIIVGTAAGTAGRVGVFDGESGLGGTAPALVGNIFYPFGTTFTGGVAVTAGDLTGDGVAQVVVGTQTKGDQVKVYTYTGPGFTQSGSTISAFGALPSTAQLELATIDVGGQGVREIAIGVLSNGYGRVDLVNEYGQLQSPTINVGGGLSAMAIASVNVNVTGSAGTSGSGADDLMIATIPKGSAQFFIINTANGNKSSSFYELPAITGGIAIAGI
jgi:hypothetical protein